VREGIAQGTPTISSSALLSGILKALRLHLLNSQLLTSIRPFAGTNEYAVRFACWLGITTWLVTQLASLLSYLGVVRCRM